MQTIGIRRGASISSATRIMKEDGYMNWEQVVVALYDRDNYKMRLTSLETSNSSLRSRASALQMRVDALTGYKSATHELEKTQEILILRRTLFQK